MTVKKMWTVPAILLVAAMLVLGCGGGSSGPSIVGTIDAPAASAAPSVGGTAIQGLVGDRTNKDIKDDAVALFQDLILAFGSIGTRLGVLDTYAYLTAMDNYFDTTAADYEDIRIDWVNDTYADVQVTVNAVPTGERDTINGTTYWSAETNKGNLHTYFTRWDQDQAIDYTVQSSRTYVLQPQAVTGGTVAGTIRTEVDRGAYDYFDNKLEEIETVTYYSEEQVAVALAFNNGIHAATFRFSIAQDGEFEELYNRSVDGAGSYSVSDIEVISGSVNYLLQGETFELGAWFFDCLDKFIVSDYVLGDTFYLDADDGKSSSAGTITVNTP
jgi:hypothetical protein